MVASSGSSISSASSIIARREREDLDPQAECTALEAEFAEVKAAYDQYFLGLERTAPSQRHEALRKRVQRLRAVSTRHTATRFRVGQLVQKYNTYERLWQRTLKDIEAGTYTRELFKARLRRKAPPKAAAAPAAGGDDDFSIDEDVDEGPDDIDQAFAAALGEAPSPRAAQLPRVAPSTLPAVRPSNAQRPAGAQRPASAAASGGLSDEKIKAIYNAYVQAKKRCGEDTRNVTLAGMSATLRQQVPQLLAQHKASRVDFKVVIKDGRAILRALPKE